jgi:uncharacterized protein
MTAPRLLVVALLVASAAAAQTNLPPPDGYVNDYANLLSDGSRAYLTDLIRRTSEETSAEIAVVTVESLQGLSVEEYANRLFNEWGIGRKDTDNGVLVLVAPTQREMRIEVGYGLEPVLPDALAGQIVRTNFLPAFRDDDYEGGIRAGVERITEVIKRNHVLDDAERAALADEGVDAAPWYFTVPFFSAFVAVGFFMLGAGLGSKTGFPVLFGSLFGGMPLAMSMLPGLSAPRYVTLPLALIVLLAGVRHGRKQPAWIKAMRAQSGTRRGGSGWVMGGNSSGSSGSSSRSGGSSFGGGRSGGGGASGRW